MSVTAEVVEAQAVVNTPGHLLELAVTRGADVDQLSKLMDLQQRWDAEQARKAFFVAKAKFQAICPVISKDKTVKFGNTEYKHASLPHIADTIREHLQQCGFSYDWKFSPAEDGLTVTCILTHQDGHSESNGTTAPADDSGSKNAIQQLGSTTTYLQRYTLIGVLGLTSADEDDDGVSTGERTMERLMRHNEALRERDNLASIHAIKIAFATGDILGAYAAYQEISDDDKRALALAWTKGGMFTPAETKIFKSDEWSAARKEYHGESE